MKEKGTVNSCVGANWKAAAKKARGGVKKVSRTDKAVFDATKRKPDEQRLYCGTRPVDAWFFEGSFVTGSGGLYGAV